MTQSPKLASTEVTDVVDETRMDGGATRSIQSATVEMPAAELERIWEPQILERLARSYWAWLRRFTFGLVHVRYPEDGREIVLLFPFLKLLTFNKPEYELGVDSASVTWRIKKGLLVARPGEGHLRIRVRRLPAWEGSPPGRARLRVDVEVANFYPRIAHSISKRLYVWTQNRIHIVACKGFLKSLAKGTLSPSVAGRFDDRP